MTKLPMVCICGANADKREAADTAFEACLRGIYDTGNWLPSVMEKKNSIDQIVLSLITDFNQHVSIEGIHADQWFAIIAKTDNERVSVQCDRIVDGFVAIWNYARDTYGLRED